MSKYEVSLIVEEDGKIIHKNVLFGHSDPSVVGLVSQNIEHEVGNGTYMRAVRSIIRQIEKNSGK